MIKIVRLKVGLDVYNQYKKLSIYDTKFLHVTTIEEPDRDYFYIKEMDFKLSYNSLNKVLYSINNLEPISKCGLNEDNHTFYFFVKHAAPGQIKKNLKKCERLYTKKWSKLYYGDPFNIYLLRNIPILIDIKRKIDNHNIKNSRIIN